jgi:hypothetical protein
MMMCAQSVDGSVLECSVYLMKLVEDTYVSACPNVGC